jgi:Novel STAND NTPase 1
MGNRNPDRFHDPSAESATLSPQASLAPVSFAAVVERLRTLENPYPGLRPFETHESHLFFGRDQQVADLVARLERNRLLAIVGLWVSNCPFSQFSR